jgi:hypothetical protein
MLLDPAYKEDSDPSSFNNSRNGPNPLKITRISQKETDQIKKEKQKNGCC